MLRRVMGAVIAGLVFAAAGFMMEESVRQRDLAKGWMQPDRWTSLRHDGYWWPAVLALVGGAFAAGSGLKRVVGAGLLGGALALLIGVEFADRWRGAAPPFSMIGSPPGSTPLSPSALTLFFRDGEEAALWLLLGVGLGVMVGVATLTERSADKGDDVKSAWDEAG
jgi:hypothetical protein